MARTIGSSRRMCVHGNRICQMENSSITEMLLNYKFVTSRMTVLMDYVLAVTIKPSVDVINSSDYV